VTSTAGHSIVIAPLGNFAKELLQAIRSETKRIFGFQSAVTPILEDLSFAYDLNRNQYHSTLILDQLAQKLPPTAARVLSIVQVDLFIPILTHVYGEAQLGGKACVVSTFRLNEGLPSSNIGNAFFERITKESIHELAHTFNLRHCRDHTCVMHYCRNEQDVDQKSNDLCRYCKIMLEDELKRL